MGWKIRIDKSALRDLARLDHAISQRIVRFINDRLGRLDDPRAVGEALRGPGLGHLWKYRVGDYRVLARIEDEELTVFVVGIGNRRDIYRR